MVNWVHARRWCQWRTVVVTIMLCCATRTHAAEQPRPRYFDLPVMPLNQALIEFALQSDLFIAVNDALIKGHHSGAIVGPYYPEKALKTLVAHANLMPVYDEVLASYVLVQKPARPALEVHTPEPMPNIEEVVVTARQLPSRYPNAVNSFVRGGVSQFDSVRFHQIINPAFINDVAAETVSEALAYSSSITPGDGLGSSNDDFFLRGFARHGIHRDAFKYSDQTAVKIAPETIGTLEVIKGPASVFYGQSDAGGVVNVAPKLPESKPFTSFTGQLDHDGLARVSVDANHPWQRKQARLIAVHENEQDSFNQAGTRTTLMPSVRLPLGEFATLDASYEYQQLTLVADQNYLILQGLDGVLAPRTLAQSVNYARPDFYAQSGLFSAALQLPLGNGWQSQATVHWQDEKRLGVRQSLGAFFYGNALLPENVITDDDVFLNLAGVISVPIKVNGNDVRFGPVVRLHDEEAFDTVYAGAWTVNGHWQTLRVEHTVALGVDAYRLDRYFEFATETRIPSVTQYLDEAQFLALLQRQVDELLATSGALGVIRREGQRIVSDEYGAYSNWHARWSPLLATSLGLRYSVLDGYLQSYNADNQNLTGASDLLAEAGITVQPWDAISAFLNYSESLIANVNFEFILSAPLATQTAQQWELGVKYLGLGGRFNMTVAGFSAQKHNLPILYRYSQQQADVAYYRQRVTGVEADASVEFGENLQLVVSGALMDPRIDGGPFHNHYAPMAVDVTAAAFLRTRWQPQWESRVGVRYVSERAGDLANTLTLSAYTNVDAHLTYFAKHWQATFTVKNVLDERYPVAFVQGLHEHFAEGRQIQLRWQTQWP